MNIRLIKPRNMSRTGRSSYACLPWLRSILLFVMSFAVAQHAQAYCTTGLGGGSSSSIDLVQIPGTTLNNSTPGSASGYYTAYPASGSTTATLYVNQTYVLNVTFGAAAIASVWIDYDQSGTFDAGEWQQITTSASSGSITITIPSTALTGTTGMRIRSRAINNNNGSGDACTNFGSGETEDYTVTIGTPTPCSGTPTAGTATATNATVCYNNTSALYLSGASVNSGLTYQWQYFDGTAWQSVTNGTGATSSYYTTGPLTATTQFRCALTCGASAVSYSAPATITVSSASLPYTEDFESIVNDNDLPGCMTATNLNNYIYTFTSPTGFANQVNHTTGGSKFASFSYGCDDYLFTPAFSLTAGQTYRISFWYITDGYSGWNTLNAAVGTSATYSAMTPLSVVVSNPTNTNYQQYVATFTATTTGVYYFGIYCQASFNPDYLTVDDINITALPPCTGAPTAGTSVCTPAAPCYNTSATLTLSGSSVNSGLSYQWQYYDGTTWQDVTTGTGGTTDIYVTDPLTASQQYRCKIICTNTSSAPVYSTPVTVTVTPAALPYFEDFESIANDNDLPGCLTVTNLNNLVYTFASPTGFANMTNHTPGGSKFAAFSYDANDYIFTPAFNLVAGKLYQFSFWYITDGNSGWNVLQALAGTAPDGSSMTIPVGTPLNNLTNTSYQQYVGTFTAPASGVYYFSINCQANFFPEFLSVDDIGLIELPPCTGNPVAGTITPAGPVNLCTGASVQLKTNGTTTAANLTYQWIQSSISNPTWVNAVGTGANTLFFTTPALLDTMYYRMVVTCTNTGLHDTTAIDTIQVPRQQFAAIPVTEDFESWSSRCDVNDIPSLYWTNMPETGDNSWRRNDEGSTANWDSPNYGFYTPNAVHGSHSARFHSGDIYLPNLDGDLRLYVDCSNSTNNKELQFYYMNDNGSDSLNVDLSTDGGVSFTNIGAYNTSTGWTYVSLSLASVSAKTVIRFTGVPDGSGSDIGLDYVRVLEPCSGTPVAGTIDTITPCPNTDFTLSLSGTSASGGLTYQWQKLNGTGWVNVAGGTQAFLTQNVGGPTTYRCIVTCSNGSASDTTPAYTVQMNTFLYCYCIPTYANGGDYDNITNVQLKNLNNNSASSGNSYPFYSDYTSQQPTPLPIPVLIQGATDTVTVDFGDDGNQYCGIWIDFNRDGNFDVSEFFTTSANAGSDGELKIPVVTPVSNVTGITRMRIRGGDDVQMTSAQACGATSSSYGEAEDYFVNIEFPPCTGPANAGTAHTSDTAMCAGYTFTLTDTTHQNNHSGLASNWETSTDGGLTWNIVPGSSNKDTIQPVFAGPVWYRFEMICINTLDSTFSNVVKVNIKPAYNCYCYSTAKGDVTDSSDIGSFSIGSYVFSGTGPHLLNGSAVRGRTDNTSAGPIELFIDSTYEVDVYQILRTANHADAKVTFFMDFNNNLQYDVPVERLFTAYSTSQNWYLVNNITIPSSVIPNVPTGMRVILNDNVAPNTPSDEACGGYTSGETEDYTVIFRQHPENIRNLQNLKNLQLYPNPTTGIFTVQFDIAKPIGTLDIQVTNVTGQQVIVQHYSDVSKQFSAEMDMSKEAKGIYFVEIKDDNEIVTRKLIVR